MTHDELLSHVAERAGLPDSQTAERTVLAVLEPLCERLRWPDLQALAEELPAPLAERLLKVSPGQELSLDALYTRVAQRESIRLGFAVERTGAVCQVVAESLSPAALHRLREALPEPMAALFTPREPSPPFEHVHLDPSRRTLAEGRPGSQHPVSEARPAGGHTHSVARSDNPHGDTKLSSATGLTQEREGETLATGHPGSNRPLSESD
jgi:uncharacterized protein (DUF2267 family)